MVVLASYKEDEMVGCAVLYVSKALDNVPIVSVLYVWIDPHYPNLFEEFIKSAESYVREVGAKTIYIATYRKAAPFERKYGKHGFQRTHTVFEKKVN